MTLHRAFWASVALVVVGIIAAGLTPSTNPPELLELAFGVGLVGVVVCGPWLAWRHHTLARHHNRPEG